MPEFVNNSVGSLPGTSGADGTIVWPLDAKKSRKVWRISALVFIEEVAGHGLTQINGWGEEYEARHASAGGHPVPPSFATEIKNWVPACAGMTSTDGEQGSGGRASIRVR